MTMLLFGQIDTMHLISYHVQTRTMKIYSISIIRCVLVNDAGMYDFATTRFDKLIHLYRILMLLIGIFCFSSPSLPLIPFPFPFPYGQHNFHKLSEQCSVNTSTGLCQFVAHHLQTKSFRSMHPISL